MTLDIATINAKVIDILTEQLPLPASAITPNARLAADLDMDSLASIEILQRLEREFDITISDRVSEQITTVGELMEYLRQRLKALA